jgi:hypothetical protein
MAFGIDHKYIKIMHVVYETLTHLIIKFFPIFLISVSKFECVSELFLVL